MNKYSENISFPKMCFVKQVIKQRKIEDVKEELKKELDRINIQNLIKENERIGITVGSRGIANLVEILKELIAEIKYLGGVPIILPAMGSHGGGTAKGQIELLSSLGVTEESLGVSIEACGESEKIGVTKSGVPVYVNKNVISNKFDKIIVFNRIKEHTEFEGEIESGIFKMCSIGIGNPKGALSVHQWALDVGYETSIVEAGDFIINNLPIVFALATVENYYHETSDIVAIKKEEIMEVEKKYLKIAKKNLGKLPYDKLDLLIVDEMGKNVSGSGMDTNVIGRIKVYGQKEPVKPDIKRIVILGTTLESHGMATGIGLADFTTKKVIDNLDFWPTNLNCITAQTPEKGALPIFFETEKESIAAALTCIGSVESKDAKVIHIKNTNEVGEMMISESLMKNLKDCLEVHGELEEMKFDEDDSIIKFNK